MKVHNINLTILHDGEVENIIREIVSSNGDLVSFNMEEAQKVYKKAIFSDGTEIPMHTNLSGVLALKDSNIFSFSEDIDYEGEAEITEEEYKNLCEVQVRKYDFISEAEEEMIVIFLNEKGNVFKLFTTKKAPRNDGEKEEIINHFTPMVSSYNAVELIAADKIEEYTIVRPVSEIPNRASYRYFELIKNGVRADLIATKRDFINLEELISIAESLNKNEFDEYKLIEDYQAYKSIQAGFSYGTELVSYDITLTNGRAYNLRTRFDLIQGLEVDRDRVASIINHVRSEVNLNNGSEIQIIQLTPTSSEEDSEDS
jgi:hypothetical protein